MSRRQELEAVLGGRGLGGSVGWKAAPAAGNLDELWRAGPAAGAITELVPGANGNTGVTSFALGLGALAGQVAWVDPLDRWDPAAAERAGVELERVLWLRGCAGIRGVEGLGRWHKVLGTLIQAVGVGLIVADFLDWPIEELRRTPRSVWFRHLRGLERDRTTALLLLAPERLSGTCARLVAGVGRRKGPQAETAANFHLELRA